MKKIKKILCLSIVATMLLNMTLSQVTVFASEVAPDLESVDQNIEKEETSETSLSFDLESLEETKTQEETDGINEEDEETVEDKLPQEEPEDKNDYVDESDKSTIEEANKEIETKKQTKDETIDADVETETDEEKETKQEEIKEETSANETSAEEIDEIITDEDLKEILEGISESETINELETIEENEVETEATIKESNSANETNAKPVEEIDIATVSEAEEIEYIGENDIYAPVATSSEADAEEIVILDEIIATLSEIKAETNAIKPIKFITETNSIIIK